MASLHTRRVPSGSSRRKNKDENVNLNRTGSVQFLDDLKTTIIDNVVTQRGAGQNHFFGDPSVFLITQ